MALEVKPDAARAAKRTAVAMTTAAVPVLLVLAQVLAVFADTYNTAFPVEVIAWATGASAFLILTATAVTRIMNIPAVNEFLTKLRLESKVEEVVSNERIEYKAITTIPDYPTKN